MTPEQLIVEINKSVANLNASLQKLSNYLEDWSSLPASVKTNVKTVANTKIDASITKLGQLKAIIAAM